MLKTKQFRYHLDNLGYLVYGRENALAIDGGAFTAILSFLKENALRLLYVANTHDHIDHTSGNAALIDKANALFLPNEKICDRTIELEGETIKVYHTPGHTRNSLCFHHDDVLITGDTLFNGTIGNCFSGDLKGFYHSMKKIMSLPADTVIYAGHDYVEDALVFAKRLEPGNKFIETYRKNYSSSHVYSRLADELRVNPYLRFNEPGIIGLLKKNKLPTKSEWQRWQSLMTID
ncbi:MAG TPA: MBL fold metallo-hydrolase [Syntrophales bacterium]|nr:MBL fold metallo-hydrolase [Syntrophales bacterium]